MLRHNTDKTESRLALSWLLLRTEYSPCYSPTDSTAHSGSHSVGVDCDTHDCVVCQCRDSCDVTRHVEHVSCLTHLSCPHARSRTHRGSAMLSRTPSSAQYAASRVMYRGRGEAMSYAIGARNARRSHYRSHSPIPRPRPLAHVRARRPHWPCTLSCCSSSNSTLAASEPIAT